MVSGAGTPRTAAEASPTALPERGFVQANGLRLHHLAYGPPDRPVLVLLHGIRLHAHVWGDFARRFADRYRIVALDQRGHGDSAWAGARGYHLHGYYEDLAAVLDTLGLARVTLIGHSLGARVAMLYAFLHSARVSRLVLVDMGAGLPAGIGQRDFSRETETPPPETFASPAAAAGYLAGILHRAPRALIEESVRHGLRRLADGRYTWKYDPTLTGPPQPRPDTREWDLWEAVRGIGCPTLLLHGALSRVVTPEIVARMAAEMPDCHPERIEGAGHALFTDRPDAFAESVGRFLRETAALEEPAAP